MHTVRGTLPGSVPVSSRMAGTQQSCSRNKGSSTDFAHACTMYRELMKDSRGESRRVSMQLRRHQIADIHDRADIFVKLVVIMDRPR